MIRSRIFLAFLALFLLAGSAKAQGGAPAHSAVLTWTAPPDAISTSTYNVYRTPNACPASGIGTLTWTKLTATPIAFLTYTDSTVTVGTWCFYVTQVQATIESGASPTAGGTAAPDKITVITVVVN